MELCLNHFKFLVKSLTQASNTLSFALNVEQIIVAVSGVATEAALQLVETSLSILLGDS